ncbi:hypothetical protein [Marinospirillum sp.]|uniref:hypothetical protein n=1 Tax=Marinospirillum sp. TaxID=2183934 RepID=UPI00286FD59E|nr:hypothetical protein [Marinospirillum sp.]MDR9468926.1 hypothetical protein [Marinospirillum sp.]
MSKQPDGIHFFSWQSRISLLLPVGFEEFQEDESTHSVIYADDLDAEDEPGARILTRCTRLFPGQQEADLQLAEQTAALPGHRLVQREVLPLAGIPAIYQQLTIKDEQGEQIALDACVQVDDLLFSINCRAPAHRAETYLPQFQQLLKSARLILLSEDRPASLDPDSGLLAHHHLRLSAWLPDGWMPIEEKPEVLRFYGPATPGMSGYQPTFSITLAEPEDYSSNDWMQELVDERLEQLQDSADYRLLEHRSLQLPDLMPAATAGNRMMTTISNYCRSSLRVATGIST